MSLLLMSLPEPMTEEEESKWFPLLPDPEAVNYVVERNLRLVIYIAKKKFGSLKNDFDDIVSAGTIGLIKAAKSFDYTKGIKFATYSDRCITNEIYMFLRNYKKQRLDISFDDPLNVDNEGNKLKLEDVVSCNGDIDEDLLYREDILEKKMLVQRYLDSLENENHKKVLVLYLSGKNQREIAAELNISQSYISRLIRRSEIALRNMANGVDSKPIKKRVKKNGEGNKMNVEVKEQVAKKMEQRDKFSQVAEELFNSHSPDWVKVAMVNSVQFIPLDQVKVSVPYLGVKKKGFFFSSALIDEMDGYYGPIDAFYSSGVLMFKINENGLLRLRPVSAKKCRAGIVQNVQLVKWLEQRGVDLFKKYTDLYFDRSSRTLYVKVDVVNLA